MSPRRLPAAFPSDDKTLPKAYAGELEPNWWCRAWNAKREKYCKARSGKGTDHIGVGRCKHHGGTQQNAAALKTGKYSKIGRPELRKMILAAAAEANPLDMLPTLAKAKGILDHSIHEYEKKENDVALADLTRAADTISKITFRIEQQRGMIPVDRLRLFMEQIFGHVDAIVKDDTTRQKLIEAIGGIRA